MKKVDKIEKLLGKLKILIEETYDDEPKPDPNPALQNQNLDLSSILESGSQQ